MSAKFHSLSTKGGIEMSIKKWLPNAVTLLLAALLVITQHVWANPIAERLTSTSTASSKTTINYQGCLTDSNGDPINDSLDMVFRLYNVESGGTALWTEAQNGVLVTECLFSVLLGSVESLPQSLFTQNDSLWLGITVGGDEEMTPREKLASAPYALAGGLPSGVIVMWSGLLSAIPEGWSLCDGTNGTPDLRDRFILSVSASEDPGETGGSHTKTLSVSNLPSHTHSFTTDPAGEHSHRIRVEKYGGSNDPRFPYPLEGWRATTYKGDGLIEAAGSHTHSGTTDATGSGSSFDIRPKYYKLAFIMKD
jgi:hypothetical protein